MHESCLHVSGIESILDHIRLVWASLFSDRALPYRQELGLDPRNSAMAVVIQEMIDRESSGVVFGMSPTKPGFVVPLAAGIVERRRGMLIHGGIIARDYGIPCVTGVPAATEIIRTGDTVTVDGFLGIVIIGRRSGPDQESTSLRASFAAR